MAVTYAWRINANKYAYILSPDGDKGHVSDYPLTGDDLASIARKANERFGEGGDEGFEGYKDAFDEMIRKLGNTAYDFLSADVYYTVDSTDCANLRGVGIKGIAYLGGWHAKDQWDSKNPIWDTEIPEGTQGTYGVYGIFMEDQEITLPISPETTKITPEQIFVVYNGMNAEGVETGNSPYALQSEVDDKIKKLTDEIDRLKDENVKLENDFKSLMGIEPGQFTEMYNTFKNLEERIAIIEEIVLPESDDSLSLSERVQNIETYINTFNPESGGGDIITGGSIDVFEIEDEGKYDILFIGEDSYDEKGYIKTVYRTSTVYYTSEINKYDDTITIGGMEIGMASDAGLRGSLNVEGNITSVYGNIEAKDGQNTGSNGVIKAKNGFYEE
jgi:hypothetical protein